MFNAIPNQPKIPDASQGQLDFAIFNDDPTPSPDAIFISRMIATLMPEAGSRTILQRALRIALIKRCEPASCYVFR